MPSVEERVASLEASQKYITNELISINKKLDNIGAKIEQRNTENGTQNVSIATINTRLEEVERKQKTFMTVICGIITSIIAGFVKIFFFGEG